MSWRLKTVVDVREEMCRKVLSGKVSVTDVARAFEVSRPTVYKWLKRYIGGGRPGLHDISRCPRKSPNRTPSEVEERIISERLERPTWGGKKIAVVLQKQGVSVPHSRTVDAILRRNGLTKPRAAAQEPVRFEREWPNDLWQFDFKSALRIRGNRSVYPFTVLDDHSRNLLALVGLLDHQMETGWAVYWETLGEYGMPLETLSDNARVFRTIGGLSQWTSRLLRLGIRHTSGRPRHPQTQGKVERLHGTLERDLLSRYKFNDLAALQRALDDFRHDYNNVRPHEALDMDVPASRYEPSHTPRPEILPDAQYAPGSIIRKIDTHGDISYNGCKIWIGAGAHGEHVRIIERGNEIVVEYAGHDVRSVPRADAISGRRL